MNWLLSKMRSIAVGSVMSTGILFVAADSIPLSGFRQEHIWRIGTELRPGYVPGTNDYLRGDNRFLRSVKSDMAVDVRGEFSFSNTSREGVLYEGLYQGIGVGVNIFYANNLLGTPLSTYVYQGAPIVRFSDKCWLGYEWRFGAAFGWKHYFESSIENYSVVSTSVTAHMGVGFKFNYEVSKRVRLSMGVDASHYSNGNTSWPNAGVNTIGASMGLTYTLDSGEGRPLAYSDIVEVDNVKKRWLYDVVAFGAWRKRIVFIGPYEDPELCPGVFGVAGFQFAPMYHLNRWMAVGGAIDIQWDESAGLSKYWVDGSYGEEMKFIRPSLLKQVSAGLSAHAELIMPIFAINVGLGYDVLSPSGNRRFYQSLTLKTFVTDKLFINTGYRLGRFKEPQNLMLGLGVRL